MRGDERSVGAPGNGGDLSFIVFSLTHAECGEGVIEIRLGERLLLGWCPACAVLETFGPFDDLRE
jgi:hypothetical protein